MNEQETNLSLKPLLETRKIGPNTKAPVLAELGLGLGLEQRTIGRQY